MVVCDIVLNTLLFTEMWYSGRESGDSGGGTRIKELKDNRENEYVTGVVGNLAVLYAGGAPNGIGSVGGGGSSSPLGRAEGGFQERTTSFPWVMSILFREVLCLREALCELCVQ